MVKSKSKPKKTKPSDGDFVAATRGLDADAFFGASPVVASALDLRSLRSVMSAGSAEGKEEAAPDGTNCCSFISAMSAAPGEPDSPGEGSGPDRSTFSVPSGATEADGCVVGPLRAGSAPLWKYASRGSIPSAPTSCRVARLDRKSVV